MRHPKHFDTDLKTSKRMANVSLKRGETEKALAKALWKEGFRYRLNYKTLPGSPDIALTKYKLAIFVDGEFWHGFEWEKRKQKIKRNREYWIEKIEENISRDRRVDSQLYGMGWIPIHFWSKDIKNDISMCIERIEEYIYPKD